MNTPRYFAMYVTGMGTYYYIGTCADAVCQVAREKCCIVNERRDDSKLNEPIEISRDRLMRAYGWRINLPSHMLYAEEKVKSGRILAEHVHSQFHGD